MSRTIVVGGGTAGLAAAYTLERAGAECLVLEKRDFSGGRIHSVVKDGFTLDLGAQFLFHRYRSTYDLLDTLGIREERVVFRPYLGALRDGQVHAASMDIKESLLHPLASLRSLRLLSNRGRLNFLKLMGKTIAVSRKLDFDDPVKAIEFDDTSCAEYAIENFGEEIFEYIMQPIASTLTLAMPERLSAAYGLALGWYFTMGLSTFKQGMGFLAKSLADGISNLELNTTVTRIVIEDKKVQGVEIASGGGTDFIEADNVICGTLADEAAELLSDLPKDMTDVLSGLDYSACTHVMIGVSGRPLGKLYAIAVPRREGFSFSGISENALKTPGYAPAGSGIVHVYTFADHARQMLEMSDEEIKKRVIGEIKRIVPSFPDDPLFCEIFRWPHAVQLCGPWQITTVRNLRNALREYGGLHLAGEYLGMPSVEAAIHYGVKSAERVLAG